MQLAHFIGELKRRRVFRVLAGYGIVAFAVLQIVEPIIHALHLSDSTLGYVVLALGLGFPLAVVLAWAFDVNDGRVERTPALNVPHRTPLLTLVLVGIGLATAAPGITYYFFLRKPVVAASIAVLPFVNMSASPENEYFSDGISEELINAFATIPGLRVASRTSAFAFKGKSVSVQQIGTELNVGAVVEGSIRREGTSLRITAQLIDTSNGYHLWSASYDRELKNIFAVEEELARSIVHALKSRLVPSEATKVVRPATADVAAHDLFLKGRYFWNKRNLDSLKRAIAYFQQAIDLDPSYAVAYAGLADSTALLHEYGSASLAEVAPRARQAALKALQLDGTLAEAHDTLGVIYQYEYEWAAAEQESRRAIELEPRYPTAHHRFALLLYSIGRTTEAVAEAETAVKLDPTSLAINNILTVSLYMNREYDRALEQVRRTLELDPGYPLAHVNFAKALLAQGHFAEALDHLERAGPLKYPDRYGGDLAYAYAKSGRRNDALRVLRELDQRARREGITLAPARAIASLGLGDIDRTFAWLDKAYEERDVALREIKCDPVYDAIRTDPRFARLLTQLKLK